VRDKRAADTSPAAVARDMLAVLLQVQRQPGDETAATLDELGLSVTHLRALAVLHVQDELPIGELAEKVSLSVPATSRTVEALHARGLLERRECPEDRRVKRVTLTAAGRDAFRRINQARRGAFERFAADLPEDDRVRLAQALAPIAARAEARK